MRTVRHGNELKTQMLDDIESALEQLLEAYNAANENPKYAELNIRAAMGDLERLKGRINGDLPRLLKYANTNKSLEHRVATLEQEVARLRTALGDQGGDIVAFDRKRGTP